MRTITALNGQMPPTLLTYVQGVFRLRTDAAASYLRMRAAGCPAGITTAYRTRAQQSFLYDLYGYPRAQAPGQSQHGEGLALDVPIDVEAWIRAHGAAHGWRFPIKAERWHCEYFPAEDRRIPPPPPPPAIPKPIDPITEDDMPLNQSDLEAIDRIVAGQLDARLRTRATTAVAPDTAGVLISQAGKEELDRLIANRMDERFRLIFDKLGIHP